MKKQKSLNILLRWALCWGLTGFALGLIATFWSTGHLPPMFVPPMLAFLGLFGGLLGGILFISGNIFFKLSSDAGSNKQLLWAAACGATTGSLMHLSGVMGALYISVIFGVVSALLSEYSKRAT